MGKRKHQDRENEIQRKIKKLEKKLSKEKDKLNENNSRSTTPPIPPLQEDDEIQMVDNQNETEPSVVEILPEEFLTALGVEGTSTDLKGENIKQEVADRWTNIIKTGIKKENLEKIINKYPAPANFAMAIAPKLNTEIQAAVSETVAKRDSKFMYRQNLTGKVLSCLGMTLTDIMKGNINSLKLIESINDAAKLLCNMNHYDSLTRRHFILTSVQPYVKQAISGVQTDSYLFGENFAEKLKTAKTMERTSITIKQQKQDYRTKPQFTPPSRNLNWKGPPLRRPPTKDNKYKGGPKNYQNPRHKQSQRGKPHRR